MPAILRKSLPNNFALITDIRSYAFYDVVGVGRAEFGHRVYLGNGMWVCNIMRFRRCGYAGVAVAFGPV